jgi:trehalose-6-phosphate synthase
VDRLDYTKGIVKRVEAIERFLEIPAIPGTLWLRAIAVPSRTQIQDYRQVKAQVERLITRLNSRFGAEIAPPLVYRYEQALEPEELAVYYRMADLAMVTSLHDGMNLVAKDLSPPRSIARAS